MGESTDKDKSEARAGTTVVSSRDGLTDDESFTPEGAQSMAFCGYRLLERIGEGSMGEVWAAQQDKPVRRKVALKLIKRGMDSSEIVKRFEAERQALALMSHPCVAKVFDAGQTPRGRPFFAMEFVRGEPITDYCDRHRLATRERLELFIQVCEGVQHAHQKGVIHRDLKPGNILVTLEDGTRPRPKIIDFGVAKATNQRLTEHTLYTELGRIIGTPEYMSPEQAEMTGLDIDTRSDVYSLGVVLYVLLTGVLPFDTKTLRSSGLLEIQRKIRDDDPPRPSTRYASLAGDTVSVAQRQGTEPGILIRRLRGDLDWITMKALEKDRTRRYDSPADFAADVRRHLNNEPVLAGSPSAAYRAAKFVRRHRVIVAAAAGLLLALIAGIVGTTAGLIRATDAEKNALQARDEAVVERDRAEQARTETEEVVGFLTGLFEESDPLETMGDELTAREILDRGANKINSGFKDQPLIRARLLQVLGNVYTNLGQLDRGLEQMRAALDILRREHGDEHPDTVDALLELTSMAAYSGDYQGSGTLAREALALATGLYGERHKTVLMAMSHVGLAADVVGTRDDARAIHMRALAIAREMPDLDPVTLEAVVRRTAFVMHDQPEEAERLYRESIALNRQIHGNAHPKTAFALDNMALFLHDMEKYDEAEPLYREVMAMLIDVYGDEHPEVAQTMGNVGSFLAERMQVSGEFVQQTYDEADTLLTRSLAMDRRWRADHSYLANNLVKLANLRAFAGRHADVELLIKEALDVYAKTLPDDHPSLAWARATLGRSLLAQQRFAEAETTLLNARASLVGAEGYEDDLKDTLSDLAATYDALNRPTVAVRYREELAALHIAP